MYLFQSTNQTFFLNIGTFQPHFSFINHYHIKYVETVIIHQNTCAKVGIKSRAIHSPINYEQKKINEA